MDRLSIGHDDDGHDDDDRDPHPDRVQDRQRPGQCQGEEDLVGGVGDGGEGVGGEDRQCDAFGQQLVAHGVGAHRATDEQPLEVVDGV